jgi:hypothetical protein
MLGGLERAGLVERRQHPTDRRSQQIFLTEAGSSRLAAALPTVQAVEDRLAAGFSESDLAVVSAGCTAWRAPHPGPMRRFQPSDLDNLCLRSHHGGTGVLAAEVRPMELLGGIQRVEHAIQTPAGDPAWRPTVSQAVAQLKAAFAAHVRETEGPSGLYAGVLGDAPRLAKGLYGLVGDHETVWEALDDLEGHLDDLDGKSGSLATATRWSARTRPG